MAVRTAVALVVAVVALVMQPARPALADALEPVHGWDDRPARPAVLQEWQPDIQPAPYFETWDMWFWDDEGTFYLVQFLTSSFGYGVERQGSGRLIIVDDGASNLGPGSPGVSLGDRGFAWEDDDWDWETERLAVRWIDCYLRDEGDHFAVRIRGRDRTAFFEATFTLDEPLFRPGDGRLDFGWDRQTFFEAQSMPRVSFDARVNRKPDRDAPDAWRDVSGVGTLVHTLTNGFPYDVVASFTRFRAFRNDGLSIVFDGLTTPADRGSRSFGWATVSLDGERLFEATDVSVTQARTQPFVGGTVTYPVPHAYDVTARNGDDWLLVRVYDGEIVSAESPFARVSAFLRAVLGALMSPYDFELSVRYDAWVHVDGHTAQVAGRGWSTSNFTR